MSILTHLIAGIAHLLITAVDLCLLLYVVHILAIRWPTVSMLQSLDRHADPVLQDFWRFIRRDRASQRMPLPWEGAVGLLLPLGMILLRALLMQGMVRFVN